ncbi:MAG: hypothetical protein QOH84_4164 [Kribbellaceae bacterium]|nr:hypothetical protein [Kribbellaceae bacterium]
MVLVPATSRASGASDQACCCVGWSGVPGNASLCWCTGCWGRPSSSMNSGRPSRREGTGPLLSTCPATGTHLRPSTPPWLCTPNPWQRPSAPNVGRGSTLRSGTRLGPSCSRLLSPSCDLPELSTLMVPFLPAGPPADAAELLSDFTAAKAARTLVWLRISKPEWSEADRLVEVEAARRFDPATAVALQLAYDRDPLPGPPVTSTPSVVIRADPSRFVSPERAAELERLGFRVRSIADAGHCVWYGRVDAFVALLDPGPPPHTNGWLGRSDRFC